MTVRLDIWGDDPLWLHVPDGIDESTDWEVYFDEHEGALERVGIDDRGLTFDEAMLIAGHYEGGEYDNETAGIVAALVVLRDHIKAVAA